MLHIHTLIKPVLFVAFMVINYSATGNILVCRNEKHRPQVHFSVPKNWLNDPNGMFYHFGEYHLYYKYHPSSTEDMQFHQISLLGRIYPWLRTLMISCVADFRNTSGFPQRENEPAVIAIFNHGDGAYPQMQSIVYSLNGGRDFPKYTKPGDSQTWHLGLQRFKGCGIQRWELGHGVGCRGQSPFLRIK